MPRRARLALDGVSTHLVQRGIDRSACFFCDDDRLHYLALLAELAPALGCAVHAYVLMTNHVHLLVTPAHGTGLSQLMRQLNQRYVQAINRAYRRSGTMWEGRFRSCLVDSEAYVLACYRYIELNPVRAGMGKRTPTHAVPTLDAWRATRPQPDLLRPPSSTAGDPRCG
jgi:putative transposase